MGVHTAPPPLPARRSPTPAWTYAWWTLVGALGGFGLTAILTVGVLFLLAAVVLACVGAAVPLLRSRAAVAVPAGVALPVLYLAWLNRGGPGDVCEAVASGTRCTQEWSPWPFVAVAAVLLVAPIALALLWRMVSPADRS